MRVSLHRIVACAAVVAGLIVSLTVLPATGQRDRLVATVEQAATLSIVPPRDMRETFLDLWIQAYTPPQRGAVEAVVSLARAGGTGEIEIGRFAIFPSEPFWATEASQQRAYRFDATAALAALKAGDGPLEVRVRLEPIAPKVSPEGAQLTLSKAEFSRRP
jgi:hypothetical protein